MNISPVSFRSTTVSGSGIDIKTLASKPQAFQKKEEPQAAGPLNGGEKKNSIGKKILGLIVGAGAIMAGLALGSKYGVFKANANGNKYIEMGKTYLNTAGEKILGWGKLAVDFGKKQWNNIKAHLPNKEKISEAVNEAVNEAPDFV